MWFDKQSRGPSISFWFRNKFPAKVVCLLILSLQQPEYAELVKPMVLINGLLRGSYDYSYYLKREEGIVELDHVYLFDLRVTPSRYDLMEMPLEEEWKHVDVTYQGMLDVNLMIFFSEGFTQLAQVRQLWLEKSSFTFLPECLGEFHNMYSLDVSDCKLLREIRGVPPNLKQFSAINCVSLGSSGSSMLLNQRSTM